MFLKTVCFIIFLTVSKIHFSKPNNATSAVTFERLELQIKKDSKYIIFIFYSTVNNLKQFYFINIHNILYFIS